MRQRASLADVVAIILGGGQGARLFPLTAQRAKPAVPLGGKYRLIDIAVSNCINSSIEKVHILTQFNSVSLHRHIMRTYRFSDLSSGFVDIQPTEQTLERRDWFQNTTDAVRRAWRHFDQGKVETFLILPGDHLYRMDYRELIQQHWDTNADLTLAVTPVSEEKAMTSGVISLDQQGRVATYREQPRGEALRQMRVGQAILDRPYLASMDIYVFKKSVLQMLLDQTTPAFDFGMELIPHAVQTGDVRAYQFEGYWEKIGSIGSFYRVNLDLVRPEPAFSLYDPVAPIYTRPRSLPSAKIRECDIEECLLGEGVILNGAHLRQSIVGVRTRIEPGAHLERTIAMGASRYQTIEETEEDHRQGRPLLGIGAGAVIRNAIIDKNVRIGAGARITNEAGIQNFDGERHYIRDGIVIIPRMAVIPDGTVI
ncbi:MAG: glucose-1-phosphate adenylyltransferase [Acidobacteria bacterium]|nr:glucose-1-phosphate adenylyltransferase [Acidobacteriota bacterium]